MQLSKKQQFRRQLYRNNVVIHLKDTIRTRTGKASTELQATLGSRACLLRAVRAVNAKLRCSAASGRSQEHGDTGAGAGAGEGGGRGRGRGRGRSSAGSLS